MTLDLDFVCKIASQVQKLISDLVSPPTRFFFIRMVIFFIEAQHSYIFSRNEPQIFLVHS